jgi:hypothetical protein
MKIGMIAGMCRTGLCHLLEYKQDRGNPQCMLMEKGSLADFQPLIFALLGAM